MQIIRPCLPLSHSQVYALMGAPRTTHDSWLCDAMLGSERLSIHASAGPTTLEMQSCNVTSEVNSTRAIWLHDHDYPRVAIVQYHIGTIYVHRAMQVHDHGCALVRRRTHWPWHVLYDRTSAQYPTNSHVTKLRLNLSFIRGKKKNLPILFITYIQLKLTLPLLK